MINGTARSRMWAPFALCPLLLLALFQFLWAGDVKKGISTGPDVEIQAIIRRAVGANHDDKDTKEAINTLNEMAPKMANTLVPQIIHYSLNVTDEKEAWRVSGLMSQLGARWGSEMRLALTPLLESGDEKVLRDVGIWLGNIDVGSKINAESNLMFYRETLLRKKDAPPPGLVNYVFSVSPRRALLLFGEINSEKPKFGDFPRDLMWSDHVITTVRWRILNQFLQDGDLENARKELNVLSKHKGWYARRYVAEIIDDVYKFATPEILDRLKKDANPLVAERAKLIKWK